MTMYQALLMALVSLPFCILKSWAQFRVLGSKLVKVVLHVGKGAKFGVEKVNGGLKK